MVPGRWQLSFGHIGIDFPHDYNFAEAFSEDFISCFKWMKLVHGKKKTPFTAESPLPADLTVRAKSITLEIQDDPFEVKLRQNYQLLEDEYLESVKRRHALDLKIDEFRKSNLLMTEATIAELYQVSLADAGNKAGNCLSASISHHFDRLFFGVQTSRYSSLPFYSQFIPRSSSEK